MFKGRFLLPVFVLLSTALMASNPAMEGLLFKLRDPATGRAGFRKSMKKVGEYLALDVAQDLQTEEKSIETVLGVEATHNLIKDKVVLVTILRAGLPMLEGFMKVFPDAEIGFFAMKRDEETLKAKLDYVALPSLEGKVVIVIDPMIATGGSMVDAIKILEKDRPARIIAAGAFATEIGFNKIHEHNASIKCFAAVVDPILNGVGYIVPGLGDAGDRAFGMKDVNIK